MEEKQKPDKKFKAGAVTAAVWANEMRDRQIQNQRPLRTDERA